MGSNLSCSQPAQSPQLGERVERDNVVQVEVSEEDLERSARYPRLHGQVSGKPYTLVDCFSTRWSWRLGRRGSEVINVGRVLRGAIFQEDGCSKATGISFGLTYFNSWIMETGIKEQWNLRGHNQLLAETTPQFRLEAFEKPDKVITAADGRVVSLKHSVGIDGDIIDRRCLTQSFSWRIDTAGDKFPMDLSLGLWPVICRTWYLFAHSRQQASSRSSSRHPDVQHKLTEDEVVPEPIDMFARWNARSDRPPGKLYEHDFLCTFERFGGIEGIRRWMNVAQEHRGSLGLVTATRYQKGMFVPDRLLNCAAALEALDRTRTGYANSKFKTRLSRCTSLAGEPFTELVSDVALWAEAVRLDRDDIAHHFGRRTRSTSINSFYLWQSLYFLYVICLFRLCEVPQQVFTHIQEHQEYHRLAREMPGVI